MTDTTSLREAILDAFDVVLSASDTPRTASEEADRIIALVTKCRQGGRPDVTDTTNLRESILSAAVDAYDDIADRAEAPLCSRFALEVAFERVEHFEIREAAAHLAATLRKMLNPPSALPTPQQLELWAAIDAVEKLTASRPPA
jgi:hypothetical protein